MNFVKYLQVRLVSRPFMLHCLCWIIAVAGSVNAMAETVKLPVTQDNSIVLVDGEWNENAGSQGRIRIKGNQHIVAMAFDTSAVEGKLIEKATLICAQAEQRISGVTLSTIAAPWDEMSCNGLTSGAMGSGAMGSISGWGYEGARFPSVIGGNSFTLVEHVSSELRDGIYYWNVPPDMVYAMAVGAAYGLAIHEDEADYSRNPTIFSREQAGKQPYLLVEYSDVEYQTPAAPSSVEVGTREGRDPQIALTAPPDAFTFDVLVDGKPLGRHNIPRAIPGQRQLITLRDLDSLQTSREQCKVSIVARARSGHSSEPVDIDVPLLGPLRSALTIPSITISPKASSTLPQLGVIPVTDKYDGRGKPVGDLPPDYRTHNSLYDGERVHLVAAGGEVVGFQMLVRGTGDLSFDFQCDPPLPRVDLFEAIAVHADDRRIPDPLVPLSEPIELSSDRDRAIVVDLYIPFDAEAGIRRGTIEFSDGRRLPIEIEVLPFSLPRAATFFCEMNSYGLPETIQQFEALQQIAYDHRVHANILHYSHHTAAPGARKSNLDMRLRSGRRMDNKRYDDIQPGEKSAFWDDFAEAFGPYIDGSLFKDGHRGPLAAPGFYLTFHESWPLNCRAHFNGDLDAYRSFAGSPEYAETYENILRDFVELAQSKGWNKTGFQVYFNNKGSLGELTKAPWVLDEPASFWDYRALDFYGKLTDRGRNPLGSNSAVRIEYRVDISRPEFCRGQLAERDDLWVVSSSAFKNYRRLVTDRMQRDELKVWVYGTSNPVHESNRDIQAWALDAWMGGASGLVPWQTVNKDGTAMMNADQLGLFIFTQNDRGEAIIRHSLRLKAYRDAQQLVEYLNLLRSRQDWSMSQMQEFINAYVQLKGQVDQRNEADAGTSRYPGFNPLDVERLRLAAARLLSDTP